MKHLFLSLVMSSLALFASAANAEPMTAQDYFEIQQLYSKYNHTIDTGDAEGYADTFTPDGVFNNNVGRDALVKFVKNWASGSGAARRHSYSNLLINGDSKQAKGSAYLTLLDLSTKPVSVAMMASYDDQLVKTPQGWRFTKRQMNRAAAPAAPATAAPPKP